MTVSTVGVTKKRVRVIEQKTNHSIEYENDVYVVDTSDPTLVLQTGSSSGVDLTGSNTLSSQANSTTTIASGASSTATIGSGNLSTVNIGTGTNSATYLKSNTIRMGSDAGNHSIYVGSYNAISGDLIHIGDTASSLVTVGTTADGYGGVSNTTSFDVKSKEVHIGQTKYTHTKSNGDTNLYLDGGGIRSRSTGSYEVASLGDIKLVSNDAALDNSGSRTYLSMDSGTASLAHTNSSNTIQAKCTLNAGAAEISGVTSATLRSDTTAVVEANNVSILGTTSLTCSSPDTNITAGTSLDLSSPTSTIKYASQRPISGGMLLNTTIHEVSSTIDSTTSGLNTINSGHIKLLARRVQHNTNANLINQTSNVSSIELDNESTDKVSIRSADGILLKAKDQEFETGSSSDRSGPFLALGSMLNLNVLTLGHYNAGGNIVDSTYVQALPTDIYINSKTNTSITTTKGNISLSANSDDDTYGDISLNADNDATLTATKGNITLNAHSTDTTLGDIKLNSDNDVSLITTRGNISLTANRNTDDGTRGDIIINADNDISVTSDTNFINCRTLSIDAFTDSDATDGSISMYSDGLVEILSGKTKTGTENTELRTGLLANNTGITLRKRVGASYSGVAGYGYYPDAATRFYSSTGFYAGNGNGGTGSGATDGYAPFTGVHMFDVQPDSNISIGDAVIVVNHTAMLTTTPNDKRVVGIVCEILENNRISVASVGDNECGQLKGFKVCNENGAISAGDLLTTSSTAGYLMKQSDDIMRSSTVGKSAVDVVFDNNNLAVDVYGFIYCG